MPLALNDQLAHMASLKIELRDLVRTKRQMRKLGLCDAGPGQPLPALEFRPTLVNTSSPDEEGCLVLADGLLVAVLVHVACIHVEQSKAAPSGWQMEAGFGCCAVPVPPLFDTLADAGAWLRTQLGAREPATLCTKDDERLSTRI